MTDVQRIVSALADCLHDNQISEDECLGVLKALRGIPPEKHMDALKAFLSVEEPELEEQPEGYLQVKTYTSDKFSVGDEVEFNGAYGRKRGVVLAVNGEKINILKGVVLSFGIVFHAVMGDGSAGEWDEDTDGWHRTGRNFPAIPAILEELKKG